MGDVSDGNMGGRPSTDAAPRQRTVAAYHSRPVGDVVLANPPPYRMLPWLGMGIPFVSALLEQHGLSSRIVRFLDDPDDAPAELGDSADAVMWGNPPLAERMAHMRALADAHGDFFELLLSRLLAGPERVFGFSAWRLNADLIIELTRQLKERRPDALVVIGGPEATVFPADFDHEWIDVVVRNGGEGAIGPVFQALVANRPAEAAGWDKVWLNPKHGGVRPAVPKRAPVPSMPRVDYAPIVPLFLGDPKPVIPVLLNVGCPFHCSFCTNSTIYPGLEWGSVQRLLEEMMQISAVWRDAFEGEAPPLRLSVCDATINAQPEQFDTLCELMAAAEWPHKPLCDAYIVLSGRVTPRRIELAIAAGFDGFFFGLETASRRLRAVVKKPGTIESVAKALEVLRDVGKGALRVTCGVIVGWPGETEEEFYETIAFLDWAATLGVFQEFSVNPLMRVPAAEDLGALVDAEGDVYGLHWRLPGPAGTPDVRARRTFHFIEHFAGVMPVHMGLPMRLVEEMLEPRVDSFWARWRAAYEARSLDKSAVPPELERAQPAVEQPIAAPTPPGAVEPELVVKAPRFVAEVQRTLGDVLSEAAGARWTLQAVSEWLADREAAVLRFASADGGQIAELLLEVRDDEKSAYARTARFNVSHLSEVAPDPALMKSVVAAIAAAETAAAASAPETPRAGAVSAHAPAAAAP